MNRKIIYVAGFMLLTMLIISCLDNNVDVHKTYTISIEAMQFHPAVLKIDKGDTVRFVNKDILQHNVTEQASSAWRSDTLNTGDEYKYVASKTEEYFCSFHPMMKGKLIVD